MNVKPGIRQEVVLGSLMRLLHTSDMLTIEDTAKTIFPDDTALNGTARDVMIYALKLQNATANFLRCAKKRNIILNESNAVDMNFINKKLPPPPE